MGLVCTRITTQYHLPPTANTDDSLNHVPLFIRQDFGCSSENKLGTQFDVNTFTKTNGD